MLSSQIPTKFQIPFASGASGAFISQPIPVPSQVGGRASLTDGFSQLNFDPLASGGIPPWGKDFNGLMYMVTAWLQWTAAGGLPVGYDATFSASIGGYPKYALLQSATGMRYWISTAENNITNPDTGGAGWSPFPDVIVQKQSGNYAVDTGSANNYVITLDPALFTTQADLVGSPIRVKAAGANSINNPLIHINSLTPATMINSSGAPLLVNQISRAGQIFEGYLDDAGFFQVTSPAPIIGGPTPTGLQPGFIYLWPNETPPTGTLECNGATYAAATYPNLFNVIGFKYGGNNVDQFKVPDYRGEFIRGWDHGRGLDKGASTRTNRGDGTVGDHNGTNEAAQVNTADFTGTVSITNIQLTGLDSAGSPVPGSGGGGTNTAIACHADIFPDFNNTAPVGAVAKVTGSGAGGWREAYVNALTGTLAGSGGLETRPININTMYIIAF